MTSLFLYIKIDLVELENLTVSYSGVRFPMHARSLVGGPVGGLAAFSPTHAREFLDLHGSCSRHHSILAFVSSLKLSNRCKRWKIVHDLQDNLEATRIGPLVGLKCQLNSWKMCFRDLGVLVVGLLIFSESL